MRSFKIWHCLTWCLFLVGVAKDALAAAPVAMPDTITALKNEVIEFNVIANDVGEDMRVISYSFPRVGEATISEGGLLVYRPKMDFVGTVVFGYGVYDESYPFQSSETSVTIIYTDPDDPTPNPDNETPDGAGENADTEKAGGIVPLGAVLSSTQAALDSHSRAISQFIKLREADRAFGADLAYWQVARGGAAGDDLLPLGGVFLSLNRQTLSSNLQPDLETDITGGTLGADFNINSQWLAGAAIGYSTGEQSLAYADAGDALDMREQSLLAFSSYRIRRWVGELQLGYSSASFDNTASSLDMDAAAQFALLKGEYAFTGMAWQIMPGVSVKYRRNTVDGFSVANQGATEQYDDHSQSHLNGVLSLYGSYAFTFNWGVLMPQLTLASDYCIDSDQSGQGVNVDGDWAVLMPASEDTHKLTVDLGLGAMFTHGFSGFINYHQVSQFDAYDQDGWSIGGRYEF